MPGASTSGGKSAQGHRLPHGRRSRNRYFYCGCGLCLRHDSHDRSQNQHGENRFHTRHSIDPSLNGFENYFVARGACAARRKVIAQQNQ
jgi:hypothetical protein